MLVQGRDGTGKAWSKPREDDVSYLFLWHITHFFIKEPMSYLDTNKSMLKNF